MWWPIVRTPLYKYDDQRLNILQDCQYITVTPVGLGNIGIGDMDDAISALGLYAVIKDDLPKLIEYARSIVPEPVLRISEAVFLTAFEEVNDLKFKLKGVVHPDHRLLPAITQI